MRCRYTLASSRFDIDNFKAYLATAHSVRDRLIESYNDTQSYFDQLGVKRVTYLSLEFLMGRSMQVSFSTAHSAIAVIRMHRYDTSQPWTAQSHAGSPCHALLPRNRA